MSSLEVFRFLTHEDDYADLSAASAVDHLSHVLQFATVSHMDDAQTDYAIFDAQQAYLRESYPHVFSAGTVEVIDHSMLITLPGTNPALKPIMLMAHQDVVSVIPGTEDDWQQPPFSGAVDDTYIWGRGAIDMKEMLVAKLEAAEYILSCGAKLKRSIIFAFGHDEESNQTGAKRLAALLAERGVEIEFLIDEGDSVIHDGSMYSAPGTWIIHADIAEKGYSDVVLTARSKGGHSSNPFGGTSLETLSRAITRICDIEWPVRLTPTTKAFLGKLAPYITEGPLAELGIKTAADVEAHADEIARACLAHPHLYPLVTTTCAPDVIEGSSDAFNTMPQDMTAVLNFRMLEGVSIADTLEACKRAVADLPVEVTLGSDGLNPVASDAADSYAMQVISEATQRYFGAGEKPFLLVNSLQVGADDAAAYGNICPSIIRFSGVFADEDDCEMGIHGTNERITKRAYLQGIRLFIKIIELACL